MNATQFVERMAEISLPAVFNPYADSCDIADAPGRGAEARRSTLQSYLAAVERSGCDTMWMGRDLGYRGGRRTGLALTDEANLHRVPIRYPGACVAKATMGAAVAERTAAEIWSVLLRVDAAPLLWNVFPFHPHEPNNPLSNRKFTRCELRLAEELNVELISWLGIKRIVALGQDAASYGRRLGIKVISIRHPSYGGVSDFRRGMSELYELQPADNACQLQLLN